MTRIYLDMDGTIADFYRGEWLNDLINENTRPYAEAQPLVEEETLLNLTENGYSLGIISWTARGGSADFNKRVRAVKKEWLKIHYPSVKFEEIHIVKYGTPKHRVTTLKNQILIDDEEKNRNEWIGIAYHPAEFFKK